MVVVGLLAIVVATLVFAVPSIVDSVRDLDDQLPRIAADLESLPLIGDELAERGVADRLQTTLEEAPDRLASDTGPLERTLRSVGDGLVATFWILLITVTALIDGRRVRDGLRTLLPAHRHDRFDRVSTIVGDIVARYAVGSLVIAAIAGTAVFTIALVGGVPLAPLLGLWAAMSNFIPQLGGFLGGAPLVVFALTTGTSKGLIILVVYLVYMKIENRIIQPVIVSKAVDIPPFVAMVAVLVGGAAAGRGRCGAGHAVGRNHQVAVQSGSIGTETPWSRPSSTARVTAFDPNRRRTSSSAASRAAAAVAIEGQLELDRVVVVEVAHGDADEREPLLLDHRRGRRQQRARPW